MKQKIFLTSALAMGVMAPAFAEPTHTGTFPSDGYMQEDYTYTNAATSTNMDGVYDGSVNAVAEYDTIDYILTAGKYLPADSETITTCPAGSFCAGGDTVQYNQTTPQGIQTCPSGFGSSADGSSSNTQCYRACDINNMGTNGSISSIAHATAISGNDYYGSGTDTCEPTACENGWHVKQGLNLTTTIGVSEAGTKEVHKSNSGTGMNSSAEDLSAYEITQNGEFVVDYGNKGKIHGHAQCSTRAGADNTWTNTYNVIDSNFISTLPDSSGKYCYCHLDSYTPVSGSAIALSAPWVFFNDRSSASDCAGYCAWLCAGRMGAEDSGSRAFRAAMFDSVQSSPAMCEANTITINWSDAAQTDIDANNAGTATYGSDVRTPVKAQTIKGKTFRGWRFSKPTETNLP